MRCPAITREAACTADLQLGQGFLDVCVCACVSGQSALVTYSLVKISHMTTPKEKTSLLVEYFLSSKDSGACVVQGGVNAHV